MSGNRSGVPLTVPRANTTTGRTVTSVLAGPHSIGNGYLSGLTTKQAMKLRGVSAEMRNAITSYPWADLDTPITSNVAGWYASFPNARKANFLGYRGGPRQLEADALVVTVGAGTLLDFLRDLEVILVDYGPNISIPLRDWRLQNPHALSANVRGRRDISDNDFVHLEGIRALHMRGCVQDTITDAAFAHLRGIKRLDMSDCRQDTITDSAFAHLAGIQVLNMSDCNQPTITDSAFAHLRGIHALSISRCNQATITDAAFSHLRGIHALDMMWCEQPTITDAALANLRGIHTLNMAHTFEVTDVALANLRGINTLYMGGPQPQITVTGIRYLEGAAHISVWGAQPEVEEEARRISMGEPQPVEHICTAGSTCAVMGGAQRRGARRKTRSRKSLKKITRKNRNGTTRH